MRNVSSSPVRGDDYEKYIPGEMALSSSNSQLGSYYVGWHTQPRDPEESLRPATEEHQFVLYSANEEIGEYQYNNGGWRTYRKRKHDWFIAPALENQIYWKPHSGEASQTPCICRIHLSPELLHLKAIECFGQANPVIRVGHRMNIQDPVMTGLACGLKDALASPSAISSLYVEQTLNLFALHVLKRYSSVEKKEISKKPRLSRARRREVIDFIQANLANDISLDELAKVACLSKYYFIHAFKTTFGMTPLQYVIAQRIHKASQLLITTELPIGLISERCGFNSASSFSKTFSQVVKATPRDYRAKCSVYKPDFS
ncbi:MULTISPECIES: helix-turn-helix domain-containing protein [unclassified Halomonas]|uniref:helix-turn-helix domain-containing protein n=1 Tax=unclassified Halomonas TaxID=2609666 RepID=UPI0007F139BE|nr:MULTISPECIES: AraC family transcriptional regulator [unclassified Halomonas]SBR45803.1 AraC family transcriptional regulator [Halomonas sp. HL-93]SNY98457.1 AraC family transcriptional regulator [Halomonas sp. hl-4]